ncbi:MAG: cellulose biosynthesis cyclic di-GMP-binding regulatory protein BcsB [Myxococcales bacterium]|nr:cellulose biosynthesis cyclic di-GMP-binding regulatory protein BcsB [Myxococcales bacterium]
MTLVVLCSMALAEPAEAPPTAEVQEPPAQTRVVEVPFHEGMYVEQDLMLLGLRGFASTDFRLPRSWQLSADPELHIYFEHSAELLADQSNLTVLLNDVPVTSAALSSENTDEGVLVATIPADSLQEYNRLTFAGTHRKTEQCQDPYDLALWTRVSRYSKLRFEVVDIPVQGELLEYPFPFFDEFGFGPAELTWVTGASASDQTLTAAGLLGFGLGRLTDYRGLRMAPAVSDLADATTHAVIVGTPEEHPGLADLVDLSELGQVKGLVAVVPNPHHPTLAVLVVTGFRSQDVISAAQALNANPRYQRLTGSVAPVQRLTDTRPPPSSQVPRPIDRDEVTLADIGLTDQTVRGYYAPQFRVPLYMEGDAAISPSGGVVWLEYGYSAGLDTSLSTMEVRLNGVTLRSVPLDYASGEASTSLRVRLPADVVEPHSHLDVAFHLFPDDYDTCEWHPDETHWATLYASSTVRIPHDHYAMLPDLGRLRFRGWPFNLEAGPVQLVLADEPSGDEISAAVAMAARMGAWSVAETPELTVATATQAQRETVREHRVLLVGQRPHSWFNALVAEQALSPPGDVAEGRASAGVGVPYVEQRLHGSTDHVLLVLKGPDVQGLKTLVTGLGAGRTLSKLDRNLAVFTPSGRIVSSTTQSPRQVGDIPRLTRAQLVLQRNWASWGVVGVLGALLFAFSVRRWAERFGGQV